MINVWLSTSKKLCCIALATLILAPPPKVFGNSLDLCCCLATWVLLGYSHKLYIEHEALDTTTRNLRDLLIFSKEQGSLPFANYTTQNSKEYSKILETDSTKFALGTPHLRPHTYLLGPFVPFLIYSRGKEFMSQIPIPKKNLYPEQETMED